MVNQHHADQLDLKLSPLAFMKRSFPGDGSYEHDQRLRSHLASCGVTSALMTAPALALSVSHSATQAGSQAGSRSLLFRQRRDR